MSKKREEDPKVSKQAAHFPSPQTLFRVVGLSNTFEQTLASVFRSSATRLGPEELTAAERIRRAETPAQVVALSGQTPGVAQLAWTRRMNEFGAGAIPAITRRLKSSQSITDESERHIAVERLIGALRRLDPPGGAVLLECFNNLDDYSQSMASVTLGVLRVDAASDALWRYYQRVKKETGRSYVIGALWGLIDVRHPRIDEALAELLGSERRYAEEYPFAALAGGSACVRSLVFRLDGALSGEERYEGERDDILMALAAVGQRLGQETLLSALRDITGDEGLIDAIAGVAQEREPDEIAQYFQMYYQNLDDELPKPLDMS